MRFHVRSIALCSLLATCLGACGRQEGRSDGRIVSAEEVEASMPPYVANRQDLADAGAKGSSETEMVDAIKLHHAEAIRALLQSGKDPRQLIDEYHLALQNQDVDAVRSLLKDGVDPNWLPYEGGGVGVPLAHAAVVGNLDLVSLLLEAGAESRSGA